MQLRRLAPLALVALAGCFVDVGAGATSPDGSSSTPGADSSAGPADTSADDAGDVSATQHATSQGPTASASEVETTDDDPTTGGPTSATDSTTSTTMTTLTTMTADPSTTSPMTMDPVTTDEPGPICGNGVLEQGEGCDDGNFDNLDDCLADCTPASCFDGYLNQGEVDGDCGGPCPPCGPCRACNSDAGCVPGLSCMAGLCNEVHTIQFNYFTDCGLNDAVFMPVDLGPYPGSWRVTALAGGGLVEENSGWGWLANCSGFALDGLSTPFIHPSAEDAFNAIDPKSIVVDYAGGPTRCGVLDTYCDDNFGGSQLGFTLACQ